MGWEWHVERTGKEKHAYKTLAVKPEGNKAVGKRSNKFRDNIKMELMEIWLGYGLDSSGSG